MKKIIICLLISVMGYTANAQRFHRFESDWKISAGINAVVSSGSRNPFKTSDFVFQFPVAVAVEHQWSEQFALEQDLNINGYKAGDTVDGNTILTENLTYFSTNTNLKWYFTDYLFDTEWLDLYISGGLGVFHMDKINTSANFSGGIQYWFNEMVAVRLQATAKFATNPKDHLYANNHFQHALQVVFRL